MTGQTIGGVPHAPQTTSSQTTQAKATAAWLPVVAGRLRRRILRLQHPLQHSCGHSDPAGLAAHCHPHTGRVGHLHANGSADAVDGCTPHPHAIPDRSARRRHIAIAHRGGHHGAGSDAHTTVANPAHTAAHYHHSADTDTHPTDTGPTNGYSSPANAATDGYDMANSDTGAAGNMDSFVEDPFQLAFEEISSRFDLYLRRLNSDQAIKERRAKEHRGLIVMDKTTYEISLQALTATFRQQGNRWGQQLRTICEVPLFVDSKSARIVQLADHIAYAVFRRYNAADLTYFNCIEGRFDQEDGVIHGLVHRKPRASNCTCPACLTRSRRGPTVP